MIEKPKKCELCGGDLFEYHIFSNEYVHWEGKLIQYKNHVYKYACQDYPNCNWEVILYCKEKVREWK